ncbi:hypothetical protein HS088_TW22G00574 [Tripterygium wilfordii]|uniref:Uncharacterized protein n=1 Tax=Tripterygium wilfordii TaxID=458696 RepID=A0A7J7BYB4_TRIWF|nr:hypothetical protein HS088_TW22G00574 [Tripterygium wilfordii]
MNLNNWCSNTGCGSSDIGYDRIVSFKVTEVNESKRSRWRVLWRKIVKERKKMFNCLSSPVLHYSYDPYAYSMNFDQGSIWVDDQDDISRSFSARFAVPSRIFDKDDRTLASLEV